MDDNAAFLATTSRFSSSSSSASELTTWFSFSVQTAMSKITTSLEVDDYKNLFLHLYLGCFSFSDPRLTDIYLILNRGKKKRPLRYLQSVFTYLFCASVHSGGGEVVSAVWAMNAGYKHQRETDNYTFRLGKSSYCAICVWMQTHPCVSVINF